MFGNDYFINNPIIQKDLFSKVKNEFGHFTDEKEIRLLKKVSNKNVQKLTFYFQKLDKENEEYEFSERYILFVRNFYKFMARKF